MSIATDNIHHSNSQNDLAPTYHRTLYSYEVQETVTSGGSFNLNVTSKRTNNVQKKIQTTTDSIVALSLLNDNWDGRGAVRVRHGAIKKAKDWIENMYIDAMCVAQPWLPPYVAAGAEGEIVLEWNKGAKGLTIHVTEEGIDYLKSWGANIHSEMEDGEVTNAQDCRDLWRWLAG